MERSLDEQSELEAAVVVAKETAMSTTTKDHLDPAGHSKSWKKRRKREAKRQQEQLEQAEAQRLAGAQFFGDGANRIKAQKLVHTVADGMARSRPAAAQDILPVNLAAALEAEREVRLQVERQALALAFQREDALRRLALSTEPPLEPLRLPDGGRHIIQLPSGVMVVAPGVLDAQSVYQLIRAEVHAMRRPEDVRCAVPLNTVPAPYPFGTSRGMPCIALLNSSFSPALTSTARLLAGVGCVGCGETPLRATRRM